MSFTGPEVFNNIFESDEAMKTIVGSIKMQRPVKVINITNEDLPTQSAIGMYLMCFTAEEITEKLDKYADKDKLYGHSVLLFDMHHIVELAGIMHGAMMPMLIDNDKQKPLKKDNEIDVIVDMMCAISNPLTYDDYLDEVLAVSGKLSNFGVPTEWNSRFIAILCSIIFVPYSNLDKILEEAEKMYNASLKEDNNEGNGETT